MSKYIYVMLFAAFTVFVSADDLTTKSGVVYQKYSVEGTSTTGLVIFHEMGGSTVPYTELPDDLRAKYKADEERAAITLKEQAEQRKKLEEQRRAWIEKQQAEREKLEAKKREEERLKAELQKEFQDLKGLFGYYLGEKISQSDIIEKKGKNGENIVLRAKRSDWGAPDCIVKLTDSGKIYLINKLFVDIADPSILLREWEKSFPALQIPVADDTGSITAILKVENRSLEIFGVSPVKDRNGKITCLGMAQIRLIDETLEPAEENIFKRVSKKHDDMQKVTWMNSLTDVVYKKDNLEFWINPYVGKFDNGEVRLRMKTRYIAERQDNRDSKWIFYDKIQFLNDRGDEIFLTTEYPEKQSEVEDFCLTEWADVLVGEKFLKLKNSKSIKVKFYGKYSHEFSLSDKQCRAFNDIVNLYEYLKSQK